MIGDTLVAFAALLFVLALMVGMSWAVKRLGLLPGQPRIKGGEKQLEVLESKLLDGRNRLVVVRWKNKEYLIATNPGGTQTISEADIAFKELVEKDETPEDKLS
ncbi:FliO/MopB family protein [Kordiimonas sp. SCSIO 12603]|uniref:FliO/MopB family protein n=1 Tax=Kordiimonas sp. SCSIO 12603 TaxID=2829596 RepID=UPI00210565EF|nr:flagellar biosynthetic protein FliO [Kordiimonas sp. SCSIO 12603]UTW57256.1 FliO/MopB family protein [Kordiimonas sp. SCSIO 12603]